ncbi:nickel transporter [Anoxybacter fermentans]|uniref:Nickel transporter n=1 Tax=Anoxybacter fermentans TaxID=1323375 RepID=A0A3Q9HNF1_9FIRM|nr:nickel transporter [Anoxybacter fermentans]
MDFRIDLILQSLPVLGQGLLMTLELTVLAVAIGTVLGTLFGLMRVSKNKIFYFLASMYVDFFRGTPLLVQLFLVYMGLPQILGFPLDRFTAAIATLSLNSGAYIAEIVRAGIQSIDKGQWEAALSLGMNYQQMMRYVILPQAFKRIIPALGNEFIAMLKDSSLVAVISLEELLRKGQLIITRTFRPFEIYFAVAILYLLLTTLISRFIAYTERRLNIESTDN